MTHVYIPRGRSRLGRGGGVVCMRVWVGGRGTKRINAFYRNFEVMLDIKVLRFWRLGLLLQLNSDCVFSTFGCRW